MDMAIGTVVSTLLSEYLPIDSIPVKVALSSVVTRLVEIGLQNFSGFGHYSLPSFLPLSKVVEVFDLHTSKCLDALLVNHLKASMQWHYDGFLCPLNVSVRLDIQGLGPLSVKKVRQVEDQRKSNGSTAGKDGHYFEIRSSIAQEEIRRFLFDIGRTVSGSLCLWRESGESGGDKERADNGEAESYFSALEMYCVKKFAARGGELVLDGMNSRIQVQRDSFEQTVLEDKFDGGTVKVRFLFDQEARHATGVELVSADLSTYELSRYVRHAIASARTAGPQGDVCEIDVYCVTRRRNWQHSRVAISKTFDNTIVSQSVKEAFVNDLDIFLKSSSEYASRGQPYKRGYVLYGEPGTGKTSIIKAAARHHSLPVYLCDLNLVTAADFDDLMTQMTAQCANRPHMLVFEDADRSKFFKGNRGRSTRWRGDDGDDDDDDGGEYYQQHAGDDKQNNKAKNTTVSMTQLINVFDGVVEPHCRILIFSANNGSKFLTPSKKFEALVRPGRIDRIVRFDVCAKDDIAKIFALFYPEAPRLDMDKIKLFDKLSQSRLTEFFMRTTDAARARDAMYGLYDWGCNAIEDQLDEAKEEKCAKVRTRKPRSATSSLDPTKMNINGLKKKLGRLEAAQHRLRTLFQQSEEGYVNWHNTCGMWLGRLQNKSKLVEQHIAAFQAHAVPGIDPIPKKTRGRPRNPAGPKQKAATVHFESADPEPSDPEPQPKQSSDPEPQPKQPREFKQPKQRSGSDSEPSEHSYFTREIESEGDESADDD